VKRIGVFLSVKLPGGGAGVAAGPPLSSKSEHSENFDKALIQVGLVLSVSDHPISEKLYVCKVEVAPGETRQVVAGLKKFVHEHELERRKVCVILNLKPAKLAGQVSEAMILAGSVPTPDGSEIVKVQSYPYPCTLILHLILFV
jgi:aminoacyl tRNA synthase complex-interacting multifunctional protein 1